MFIEVTKVDENDKKETVFIPLSNIGLISFSKQEGSKVFISLISKKHGIYIEESIGYIEEALREARMLLKPEKLPPEIEY